MCCVGQDVSATFQHAGAATIAGYGPVIRAAILLVCVVSSSACLFTLHHPAPPPPTAPTGLRSLWCRVDSSRAWTDAGVAVRTGDRLTFWATGEIRRGPSPDDAVGPDGVGWSSFGVGRSGLIGRICDHKRFDIGARTHLFPDMHARPPYIPFSPPPLKMKHDGALRLGFKDWKPGVYRGAFSVSIWRQP